MPVSQGVALGCYVKAFQALRPVFIYTLHFHNHLEPSVFPTVISYPEHPTESRRKRAISDQRLAVIGQRSAISDQPSGAGKKD